MLPRFVDAASEGLSLISNALARNRQHAKAAAGIPRGAEQSGGLAEDPKRQGVDADASECAKQHGKAGWRRTSVRGRRR